MKFNDNSMVGNPSSHASHEACELKCRHSPPISAPRFRHASHEACELKSSIRGYYIILNSHASHEACELKWTVISEHGERRIVTPRMRRVS